MRGRQAGLAESAEALTGMQRALDERGRRMAAAEARAERGAAAAEAAEAAAAELRAQLAQCAPRNCMSLQIACLQDRVDLVRPRTLPPWPPSSARPCRRPESSPAYLRFTCAWAAEPGSERAAAATAARRLAATARLRPARWRMRRPSSRACAWSSAMQACEQGPLYTAVSRQTVMLPMRRASWMWVVVFLI